MRLLPIFLALLTATLAHAAPLDPIPLWTGETPHAKGTAETDIPTLTAFLPAPEKATGAAFVICPGGGYGMLAPHEGQGYAEWLAENGIAGLVLRYRLGSAGYRHPVMLEDAARAVRLARTKAAEWRIDPKKVGIMGSSAGGHLASTLLTHFDAGQAAHADPVEQQSSRPDLGILCYAVVSMGPETHGGSKKNLLGDSPSAELIDLLSNEKHVTPQTPQTFLWHTWEDKAVKLENAYAFSMALQKAGVPHECHVYQKGAHGIGLGSGRAGGARHRWSEDCLAWLREQGWAR